MSADRPTHAGFWWLQVSGTRHEMKVRAFERSGVWLFETRTGQIHTLNAVPGSRWTPCSPLSPPQPSTSEQVGQACADAGTETPDDGGRGTNLIAVIILVGAVVALCVPTLDPMVTMSFAAGALLVLAAFVLSVRRSRKMREAQPQGAGSAGSHDAVTTGASCEATTKSGGE